MVSISKNSLEDSISKPSMVLTIAPDDFWQWMKRIEAELLHFDLKHITFKC